MNSSDRALKLVLIEPQPPVCVRIRDVFSLRVQVVASHVNQCEVHLVFDEAIMEETSGHPARRSLDCRTVQELSWRFLAKRATAKTYLSIEGQGEGLFQMIDFPVEVIQ